DRLDYKEARQWENRRKSVKEGSSFNFHNTTFTGNSLLGDSGIINDEGEPLKKWDFRPRKKVDYSDISDSDITDLNYEEPSLGIDHYELVNKIAMQNDNDGFQTPPHQIVSNIYNEEISINENILRMSAKSLVKLDESKETTESGSIKSISDWIRITEELGIVKEKDNKELIQIKKYLNRVMLPLIESFTNPTPDISATNSSEHHYWSEFGHRFFSRALQELIGLDWKAVIDGKSADLLAWIEKTGEEIFVGEQAGPPTKCYLTKLAMDSFKLYREM
ncbi:6346_t:CDS:2, partial [Acaulospora colombiana]